MTATYDPDLIDRLVRETREALRPDDSAITSLRLALARRCSDTPVSDLAHDAQATLWQLQQIARGAHAMADQLEAARREIERTELIATIGRAYVRITELDRLCDLHGGMNDDVGIRAERELADLVAAVQPMLDAYRAAKGNRP